MSVFYENFVAVCAKKGVAPSKAAEDIGLSRTSPNGWKKGKKPSDVTLEKLSQYFGVPVSDLTGEGQKKEPALENENGVSPKELIFNKIDEMAAKGDTQSLLEVLGHLSQKLQNK